MSIKQSIVFFFLCCLIFITIGGIIGALGYIIRPNLVSAYLLLSPIVSFGIAYYLTWKFLIKGKYEVFEISDYQGIKDRLWIPVLVIVLGLQIINQLLIDVYNDTFYPELYGVLKNRIPELSFSFVFTSLTSIIIAPICEEILYRKVIFKELLKKNSFQVSILLSSLFFSLMHLPLFGKLLPTFLLGLASAYIYFKTGKIGYSILLHFFNNFLAYYGDFYLSDLWNWIRDFKYQYQFWLILAFGIGVFLFGLKWFSGNVTKNPRENL